MHLSGVGPVAFFSGTIFALGAQKPPLTRILPSHLGERPQKKEQKSSLKMHPSGIRPDAFFWGTFLLGDTFSLGGTKTSFGTDSALTFGSEDLKQNKKVLITNAPQWCWSCYFFGGTHSRLGAQKPPLVRILPSHLGVKKTKQKGLDHKCTPMVLVLLLSFGAQFSLAWGATVLA